MQNPFHLLLAALLICQTLSADDFERKIKPVLGAHCIKCHGEKGKIKGKVNLLELTQGKHLLAKPELIEDMLAVIEDYEMPPEDEDELPEDVHQALIENLGHLREKALQDAEFAVTPIRRMNRVQYNHAVVDLLGLTRGVFQLNEKLMRRYSDHFDPAKKAMPPQVRVASRPLSKDLDGRRPEGFRGVAAFPQDLRAEHGYDTQADHLTLSPLLMESFLTLSQTIVNSPDLNPRECRYWDRYFAPPRQAVDGAGTARTTEVEAITARTKELLRRAYRRPVDADTLARFTAFGEKKLAAGTGFTDSMRAIVGAIMASPEFLYFYVDKGDRPGVQVVPDFELAERLALFIWGSIPDDQLLDLAEQGKLREPAVIDAQVKRMLNDRKSMRFVDTFPGQWLQLDRLVASIPDMKEFKHFYYDTGYRASMHMMMEPLLLFEAVYLEDLPLMTLLNPDFTYRSRELNNAYRASGNGGEEQVMNFVREAVSDPRWGGVITNAAVMTMTSAPSRTQPITRGAWVNTVIFNDPPEPPPADVPPLPEADGEALAKLTIRERFAVHRERADCAACHNQIDPLGFSLENYNPTGVWRDSYANGRKIDASGLLFNKKPFKSVVEFKKLLLEEKPRFVRGFAAHLMAYGLGRQLNAADSRALDDIAERVMAGEDSLRSVIRMVATSEPFMYKNTK